MAGRRVEAVVIRPDDPYGSVEPDDPYGSVDGCAPVLAPRLLTTGWLRRRQISADPADAKEP